MAPDNVTAQPGNPGSGPIANQHNGNAGGGSGGAAGGPSGGAWGDDIDFDLNNDLSANGYMK